MTDFVLHIGLSKCGSTFIQMKGFLEYPNYLGRGGSPARYGNQLTSEFLRRSHINRLPALGSMKAWGRKTYEYVDEKCGGPPPTCVLSSEALGKPVRSSYAPLIEFLKKFQSTGWPWGQVKVVIVFRSQAQRIASMFAQSSPRCFNANQEKFEEFCQECLRSGVSLEYFDLFSVLRDALGQKNVLALFLEEIGTHGFWCKLLEFSVRVEEHSAIAKLIDTPSNKRSTSSSTWALPEPLSDEISRSAANSLLTWAWPATLFPGIRLKMRDGVAKFDAQLRRARFRGETNRATHIELTPALSDKIMAHYLSGNQKLAASVSKDLGALGYY